MDAAAKVNGNSFNGWFREAYDKGSIPIATDEEVKRQLEKRGCRYVFDHSSDYTLLERYTDTNGVVVSFKPGTPGFGFHTVYLLSYGEYVYLYDPNDKTVKERTLTFFKQHWWGDAVILLGDR